MEAVMQLIKKKGQRFTSQKKDVMLALQKKPQTVLEIFDLVKSAKKSIDKATVYRILTGFVEMGIVRDVHLGNREIRYELTDNEHHHHLVCDNCGSIEDISLSEDALLKEAHTQSSFKIRTHSLEFFGMCKKCQ
jgi:Fur family ferric uptake transcriptional regulator